jgi:transcriptional regulator with XRE-family HTH domain
MIIRDRLQELRKAKNLSQGEIEKRTGLLRCYISRVENGHTVPSLETLEKMAGALEIPLYRLFYEGTEPPKLPDLPPGKERVADDWGNSGEWARFMERLRSLLGRIRESDRQILLTLVLRMARKNRA